jgi:hypothetical protein
MIFSRLYWFLALALIAAALPAEASRKHSIRPSASMAIKAPAPAAESEGSELTAVEVIESPKPDRPAEPRRGLLEILFGRGNGQAALPRVDQDVDMDERMFEAVRLAERSARSRSIHRCWRFVKRALQEAGVVECYPQTALAKQAAVELPERYGFKEIDVKDPHDAPVGAVLVYGGRGAGHVELRTETGFVSDHASLKPSPRPLIGVFVKPLEG